MQLPGDQIMDMLNEIEDVLYDAKPAPLGLGGQQRKLANVETIAEIVDEIKEFFPQEFQDARRIVKEHDDILDRATQQAESIIADAKQQAMILAGDQEVVRLAQQQADAIKEEAADYERDTRYNAEQYADTVLARLEENLASLTNSVSRVRTTLSENSGPRNTSQNVAW